MAATDGRNAEETKIRSKLKLTFECRGNTKQLECCKAWVDDTATDIVFGGAKGGSKSFTGGKLIFGDALMYPETYYFIARNKLSDLIRFTVPSINEVFTDWGLDITKYAKFNGQYNYYELYNKSRVYLLDAAYMPSDPLYMRFGSMQFTRGWGEETGEWDESAKNNLQASVGRWKNDVYKLVPKFFQTCNPSKNYLYREYYKKWKAGTLEPWKRFIQALPTDNKMLPSGYIEQLQRTLSHSEKERLLYGNWEFDDDPATLIPYEKILEVFTNTHVQKEGRKCITADIARLGGDRIVIIEWYGFYGIVKAYQREKLNVTTTNIEAARFRMGIGKGDVLVDSDGMGSGVEDFGGFKGFVNNARPLPDPKNPVRDKKGAPLPENFANLKSQCGFRMADRIKTNGIYLECQEWMKPLIIEEMEQVKQKLMDSDQKNALMPKDEVKERIGRSPDFWDAIMQREYFELKPQFKVAVASV